MSPKVSVVVPVYNVEKYLEECLQSVADQTLSDIEVIVVNDGSTDGSMDIIKRFVDSDERFKVIDKPNAGYGNSMNRGFDAAQGEYIGIVESDDVADTDMFETLYRYADRYHPDIVKSNYKELYTGKPDTILIDLLYDKYAPYYKPIAPVEHPAVVRGNPAVWTAIYRRDFIEKEGIRFLESPGASYQDTGFALKAWAAAESAVLLREAFLNYRQDNSSSSVKSSGKVFCICDEYASYDEFMESRPEHRAAFQKMMVAKKYESYIWNFNRLDKSLRPEFLERMGEEFAAARAQGIADRSLFQDREWEQFNLIIDDPGYFKDRDIEVCCDPPKGLERELTLQKNSGRSKVAYFSRRVAGKALRSIRS